MQDKDRDHIDQKTSGGGKVWQRQRVKVDKGLSDWLLEVVLCTGL